MKDLKVREAHLVSEKERKQLTRKEEETLQWP